MPPDAGRVNIWRDAPRPDEPLTPALTPPLLLRQPVFQQIMRDREGRWCDEGGAFVACHRGADLSGAEPARFLDLGCVERQFVAQRFAGAGDHQR